MAPRIWTEHYDVNTMVLDHAKRLSLVGLLNILQDAAWMHAQALGWGYDDLIARGTIWVLARQKLVMREWPLWETKLTIQTWPRDGGGVQARREFAIFAGDKRIGECTTTWIVLDWTTRRPRKLDRDAFSAMFGAEGLLDIEAGRIATRDDLKPAAAYQVRNSDLDVNGHVNNTRYAQWITDSMAAEELAAYDITEYEVNFLSETGLGDAVTIEGEDGTLDADGLLHRQYQGRKTGADKPAFAARLSLRQR